MSDRHRLAATAFGAIGIGMALYVHWSFVKAVGSLVGGLSSGHRLGPMVSLVVPAATIFLENRVRVPDAVARVRANI